MRAVRGDWQPGRTHPILLALQLVILWQAGLRGLDYADGTVHGLDAAAGDPVYGWLLYGSTVLVLLGLAIRRGVPVILGHALLASWYAGLGWTTLFGGGDPPSLFVAGPLATSAAGVWLLLSDRFPWHGRFLGLAVMLVGQGLLVAGLGDDYRTGTGLLSVGAQHGVLAVGTVILWQRDRLRRVVDREAPP